MNDHGAGSCSGDLQRGFAAGICSGDSPTGRNLFALHAQYETTHVRSSIERQLGAQLLRTRDNKQLVHRKFTGHDDVDPTIV